MLSLRQVFPWLLLAVVTVASGFVDLRVRAYPEYVYQKYIPAVIDGTYGAPAIYRVLVPYVITWIQRTTAWEIANIWHATRLLTFFVAYVSLIRYLRLWVPAQTALLGTLLVAATLPMSYTNSWAHPDHIAELALFSLACMAISLEYDLLFGIVLFLSALNRETSVFLVLLYALARPFTSMHATKVAALALVWVAVFVGLRFWRGIQHYEYVQLWRNLEFLKLIPPPRDPYYRSYAYFGILVFGALFSLALAEISSKPRFVQAGVWTAVPFVLVSFTFSSIVEPRIFAPLYPLLLPSAALTIANAAERRDWPA